MAVMSVGIAGMGLVAGLAPATQPGSHGSPPTDGAEADRARLLDVSELGSSTDPKEGTSEAPDTLRGPAPRHLPACDCRHLVTWSA